MLYRIFAGVVLLSLLPASTAHANSPDLPNWDRELALEVAASTAVHSEVSDTLKALRPDSKLPVLGLLESMSQKPDWSGPARDRAMFEFTRALADYRPDEVADSVIEFVSAYQPKTLVAHEETTEIGVPLYPVGAAMAGVRNQWRADAAYEEASRLVQSSPETLLGRYVANADVPYRRGIRKAISSAPGEHLGGLIQAGLPSASLPMSRLSTLAGLSCD